MKRGKKARDARDAVFEPWCGRSFFGCSAASCAEGMLFCHRAVLALRRGKYEGFNDQHLPRKRRPPKHRRRRERKAQAGQMICGTAATTTGSRGEGRGCV